MKGRNTQRTIIAIEHDDNLDFLAPIMALAMHGRTISVLCTEDIGYEAVSAPHAAEHVVDTPEKPRTKSLPKPPRITTHQEKIKKYEAMGLPWIKSDQGNIVIDIPATLAKFGWTLEYLKKGKWRIGTPQYTVNHAISISKAYKEKDAA